MKVIESLRNKMEGLIQAANRYPLTVLFLIATAVVNAISINNETEDYSRYIFTFVIGALLSAVSQHVFERFFTKTSERIMLLGGAVLLSAAYYFAIQSASVFSPEIGTKTGVTMFALVMAFIWIPTIKSKIAFHESFMSTFKAFFITVLFTAVIAGGVSAIIFAIDSLLFSVNNNAIPHALSIVVCLFAPIFFLSFMPPHPGKRDTNSTTEELTQQEEKVEKAISCPKNLGILISYIIIPLTAVYTVILLAYVILNIRDNFWTKNLLEPLLVSYAVTVILVYLLASGLENKFASLFRKVFPKVLVPIVLFQTIASILKIQEMGITHGRYYVILFGIFATIVGLIFSFLPIKKHGVIAAILIVFSAISIIPPIDAFTVSRVNQINLLEKTLLENNMLENDTIVPNSAVSKEDKKIITHTVSYIDSMNYANEIDWLPDNVFYYDNFKKTFGFEEVYDQLSNGTAQGQSAYLDWNHNPVLNIEDYDRMIHMNIYSSQAEMDSEQPIPIEKDGMSYILTKQLVGDYFTISLMDENEEELIQFDTMEIFNKLLENNPEGYEGKGNTLTVEKATIIQENDRVKMSILVNSVDVYDAEYSVDFYVLFKIK